MNQPKTKEDKYFTMETGYCPITGLVEYKGSKGSTAEKKKKRESYHKNKKGSK